MGQVIPRLKPKGGSRCYVMNIRSLIINNIFWPSRTVLEGIERIMYCKGTYYLAVHSSGTQLFSFALSVLDWQHRICNE